MKPKRSASLERETLKKLIVIGQDANLSYKEIMEQIPVSYYQIRLVMRKGLIPPRQLDYDKLQRLRVLGGRNSALVRWGHYYED